MGDLIALPTRPRDDVQRGNRGGTIGGGGQPASPRRRAAALVHHDGPLDPLIERYLKARYEVGEIGKRSVYEHRLILWQFSEACGTLRFEKVGKRKRLVVQLGESHVQRWLAQIREFAPATRRMRLSVVRGFCNWLVRKGHVRRDPCLEIRPPRQPDSVPKIFTPEQAADLLDVCTDARSRLVVLMAFQEGMRCGEMSRCQLGHIDDRNIVVYGKGGKERVVPVLAEFREALDDYLLERGAHAGPLLINHTRPGQGLVPRTISRLFSDLCREAGVKRFAGDGISAHGGRRTCASNMAENGASMLDTAEFLGHKSMETTRQHYTRHNASRLATVAAGRRYGRRVIELEQTA